ncbi:MAG: hypothetical protein Q9204_003581 [Flavoplaca sp. TL-2023a]
MQPAEASPPTISASNHDRASYRLPFFSLPLELRFQIYRYLCPQRIHIADSREYLPGRWGYCKTYPTNAKTRPWAPILVSREFRREVRSVVYPITPIVIHMRSKEMELAFNTWIEYLDDVVAPSVKHLCINGYIEFNYLPDGPITEQPFHWLEQQYQDFAFFEDEDEAVCEDTDKIGEWKIKWLRYPYNNYQEGKSTAREDALMDTIFDLRPFWENSGRGVLVGLGKDNIRSLVAAYNSTQSQPKRAWMVVQPLTDGEEGDKASDDEEDFCWDEEVEDSSQ